jgi:hypothetical protein
MGTHITIIEFLSIGLITIVLYALLKAFIQTLKN